MLILWQRGLECHRRKSDYTNTHRCHVSLSKRHCEWGLARRGESVSVYSKTVKWEGRPTESKTEKKVNEKMPHIWSVKPNFVLMKIMSDCISFYVEMVHFIKCLENTKHNSEYFLKISSFLLCMPPPWALINEVRTKTTLGALCLPPFSPELSRRSNQIWEPPTGGVCTVAGSPRSSFTPDIPAVLH